MDIVNLILSLSAGINLVLAVVIYSHNPKDRTNSFYAIAVAGAALWAFSMLMFRILPLESELLLFWTRNLYFSASFIALGFFYFSLEFPHSFISQSSPGKLKIFLFRYTPLFIATPIIALIFFPNFITDLSQQDSLKFVHFGFSYPLYAVYIILFFVLAFTALYYKFRKSKGIEQLQIFFIVLGVLIPTVVGVVFDLILPFFGDFQLFWLGPAAVPIMSIFIAYGISRHYLLNIRVISTEIFVGLLVITLFLRVFSFTDITELWFNITVLVFGVIVGWLLIRASLKEVSSREQIETLNLQLQRSVEELQKLDELKSEFVGLASHQLRTPLTPIKGFSDMMRKGEIGGKLNKDQQDVTEKIYEASQRMVEIIDDLLNVSKLEKEGGFTYSFTRQDPEVFMKELIDEIAYQAKDKKLTLTFTSHLSKGIVVKIDKAKLKDAIQNIIVNAIKYTPRGGIVVSIREDMEWVRISIKDTGVGIDPEDISKIFQKFFRGKVVSRLATEGTGLGLYFTKHIIDDHGGRVWVESEGIEKGSEFIIRLPKVV